MDIRTTELAAGIFRLSVFCPQSQGRAAFMFRPRFLIGVTTESVSTAACEMFPLVSEAVGRLILSRNCAGWASVFEATSCGSMNEMACRISSCAGGRMAR